MPCPARGSPARLQMQAWGGAEAAATLARLQEDKPEIPDVSGQGVVLGTREAPSAPEAGGGCGSKAQDARAGPPGPRSRGQTQGWS